MRPWLHTITIKHLFTEQEDFESVQKSMNLIADELDKDEWFKSFKERSRFRKIRRNDDELSPVEHANKLLDKMYDYADEKRIWIG